MDQKGGVESSKDTNSLPADERDLVKWLEHQAEYEQIRYVFPGSYGSF